MISFDSFILSELGRLPVRLLLSEPARSMRLHLPSTSLPEDGSSVETMTLKMAWDREDVSLSLVEPVERRAEAVLRDWRGQ